MLNTHERWKIAKKIEKKYICIVYAIANSNRHWSNIETCPVNLIQSNIYIYVYIDFWNMKNMKMKQNANKE